MKRLLIALIVLGLAGCGEEEMPDGYVLISSGVFMMGSPESEPGHEDDETLHEVTISQHFYMMDHEVTQAEWTALMGTRETAFPDCGGDCPIHSVNWWEVLHYANALSRKEGLKECYIIGECYDGSAAPFECASVKLQSRTGEITESPNQCEGYRLPTEAEWEYAARAGTTDAFYSGSNVNSNYAIGEPREPEPNLDAIGWYRDNAYSSIHPVKGKKPNAWGLYDMSGNVGEWVWDFYGPYDGDRYNPSGPYRGYERVVRGGTYSSMPPSARSAARSYDDPVWSWRNVGFRLVRTSFWQ